MSLENAYLEVIFPNSSCVAAFAHGAALGVSGNEWGTLQGSVAHSARRELARRKHRGSTNRFKKEWTPTLRYSCEWLTTFINYGTKQKQCCCYLVRAIFHVYT